ncbi:hypothetical protein GM3708_1154 [Geminocystis sp. NIES-3708]|nr:hypothetical protein GM3708_1154 [Geminocystis sp. NIES-3708]
MKKFFGEGKSEDLREILINHDFYSYYFRDLDVKKALK